MRKKILIVEDHEEMQFLYRAVFRKESDIEIVNQVATAEAALEAVPKTNPDLAIIDITLPGIDGIELTKLISKDYPAIKIIVVTAHDYELYLKAALEAGANKLVTKDNISEILNQAKILLGLN